MGVLQKALTVALSLGLALGFAWLLDGGAATSYADPGVIYVDAGATGAGTGLSWTDAYTDLQKALAGAGPSDEIWVAEGTYKPTSRKVRPISFRLKSGVELYGGFAGNETSREQRDWRASVTILSGDIGAPGVKTDNSYHVVLCGGMDATAVLDGFTVTGGNAHSLTYPHDRGGGMYSVGGAPTLRNLIFSGNSSEDFGGGVCNDYSSPTLINVIFSGDSSGYGGGIYNRGSSPTLINVVFSGNSAKHGGGMYNCYGSCPALVSVTFSGNSATYDGSGVQNSDDSNPTMSNSILWGNSAPEGSQVYNSHSDPSIIYSIVQGGYPGAGNKDQDPLFVNAAGGNLRLKPKSPAIDAGSNASLPADSTDLDDDGDRAEKTPLDLDGNPRLADAPETPDVGRGTPPVVDMGAYEFQG